MSREVEPGVKPGSAAETVFSDVFFQRETDEDEHEIR